MAVGVLFAQPTQAIDFELPSNESDAVRLWVDATLAAISNTSLGPTPVSRAIGMVSTGMYDAWAAYDPVAIGTQLGGTLQVDAGDLTLENKKEAISFAAYTILAELFPSEIATFNELMNELGYEYSETTNINTPGGVGNIAANALLEFRRQDNSNQLNDYADTSGYEPINAWNNVVDPNRWQPLSVDNGKTIQEFLTPHWSNVIPFAFTSDEGFEEEDEDRYFPPPPVLLRNGKYESVKYIQQSLDLIEISAELTDEQKVIAEYWADGPDTTLPPGHWQLFGLFVSVRDNLSLDENAQLFFGLGNAVLDAGIAAWDAKEFYDYVRPFTSIRYLSANRLLPVKHPNVRRSYTGKIEIFAWGGPNQGSKWILGTEWLPYQDITSVTPPFAEYVSGHSTFSAAAAEILYQFTESDYFGGCHTQPPNSSTFENNTPAEEVELCWDTFTIAADEAGISRLYGGIHFTDGDLNGRKLGRRIGQSVWQRTQYFINGGKQG
ncbi:MAG: vanadium-dependent haloperoxidase [Leptolyngbyaceae cyanobacterium MO_188.B28]|nr:vanadium-dependent haloperoxidase [Leptolyngbyaceae cyanobacterium MO_188.B28]